jgi:hypothetical protein
MASVQLWDRLFPESKMTMDVVEHRLATHPPEQANAVYDDIGEEMPWPLN